MSDDNVTPLRPDKGIGTKDPAVRRALQLATERLVRNHKDEFRRLLTEELRRTGSLGGDSA